MDTLIHDSQHLDENSERHEVKMLTAFAEKNMACQGMNVCIISYKVYYWPSTDISQVIKVHDNWGVAELLYGYEF